MKVRLEGQFLAIIIIVGVCLGVVVVQEDRLQFECGRRVLTVHRLAQCR